MDVKELDVVELKGGQIGTVVYIFPLPSLAYEIEIEGKDGEMLTALPRDVRRILWAAAPRDSDSAVSPVSVA